MSSLHNFRQGTHYLLSDTGDKPRQNRAFLLFVDFLVLLVLFFSDFGAKPTFDLQEAISRLTSGPMLPGESPRSSRALNGKASEILHHVTAYLLKQEARETNAWKIDDLRIARMTLGFVRQGISDPWNYAFWSYYGKTLPHALEVWGERDRQTTAMLESVAAQVRLEELAALNSLSPKKPVGSSRNISGKEEIA